MVGVHSLNGTYVNRGSRLLPGSPERLKNDDEVVMGKTFFKVVLEYGLPPPPPSVWRGFFVSSEALSDTVDDPALVEV